MLTFLIWYMAATTTGQPKDMWAGLAILGTFTGIAPGLDICLIIFAIKGMVKAGVQKARELKNPSEPDTRTHLEKCMDAHKIVERKGIWEDDEDD